MEITAVESYVLNPGVGKNWILLDITTDSGIRGVGEAFGTGKDLATVAVIEEMAHSLVGEDPRGVLRHRDAAIRSARYPMGAAEMAAVSAVEMALWDIAGKSLGAPVHELLGGPVRDRVRVYAGGLYVYSYGEVSKGAAGAKANGFTDVKIVPGEMLTATPDAATLTRHLNDQIAAIRSVAGEGMGIAVDYHGRSSSPTDAMIVLDGLSENLLFFEEPVLWTSVDPLVQVKSSTTQPIAAGEKIIQEQQWFELVRRRAVDYLQPDPAVCGGISETIRIAGAAAAQQIELAPHHASGPVSLAACLQIDSVVPSFFMQEWGVRPDLPNLGDLCSELPSVSDGYATLTEAPGLGVDFDPVVARSLESEPYRRPIIRNPDGSIGFE